MRGLARRLATATCLVAVFAPLGVLHPQSLTNAPLPLTFASAPYLMPFADNPPDPAAVIRATGQRTFQLAYLVAPTGGGCRPTWNGTRDAGTDPDAAALIARIRSSGGDVGISVGGYVGTTLGQVCPTPQATAAAYQSVVTRHRLRAIDFDIEASGYANPRAVRNELGAAQILQRDNPRLFVSVTTTGTANGVGRLGERVLTVAKDLGFMPDDFSITPFGDAVAGTAAQIRALDGFHATLMATFGLDSATAFTREGVVLLNGRSEDGTTYPPPAFQDVLTYAVVNHLARFSFRSVNRDRPCTAADGSGVSGVCSGVPQVAFAFTRFTARFAALRRVDAAPLHAG